MSRAPDSPGADAPKAGISKVLIGAVVAVLVIPIGLIALMVFAGSDREGVEHTITVPAGTWDRIVEGEDVELMPLEMNLKVGDRLVVENFDDRTHVVGPYRVRSGERLVQRFNEPTTIEGECTLTPQETVRIIVS